ncbi:MAG TPA: pilin [Candidatus Paceibacterota bacterium]|nr:pilin [Candidatus Paceibacterota bacterium]
MNKKTKIITILLCGLLLLPLFSLFADEVDYPDLPNVPAPTPEQGLPSYVNYIFNIALALGGLVAFGVLIWGGVLYLTSAGNPEQIGSAKKKLTSAISGLLILLCVYLILTTINPDLALLSLPTISPTSGVWLVKSNGEKIYFSDNASPVSLTGISGIEFISSRDKLMGVYLYTKSNYLGGEEWVETPENIENSVSVNTSNVKSIYFLWRKPGVYLYPETNFQGRPLYVKDSVSDLGKIKSSGYNGFDNKTSSVRIINELPIRYGVVLFEMPGFYSENNCPDIYSVSKEILEIPNLSISTPVADRSYNNPPIGNEKVSSLVVFYYNWSNPSSGKITFFDKTGCSQATGSPLGINIDPYDVKKGRFSDYSYGSGSESWDGKVISFMISGSAAVILKTGDIWEGKEDGFCMYFSRDRGGFEENGCYSKLHVLTSIFDPSAGIYPRKYVILPIRD